MRALDSICHQAVAGMAAEAAAAVALAWMFLSLRDSVPSLAFREWEAVTAATAFSWPNGYT